MEHTKGPWIVGNVIEDYPEPYIEDWTGAADGAIEITWNYGAPIAYVCLDDRMQANARRIVACVNACEGLSDNFLLAALNRDETPIKSLLNGYADDLSKVELELYELTAFVNELRCTLGDLPLHGMADAVRNLSMDAK